MKVLYVGERDGSFGATPRRSPPASRAGLFSGRRRQAWASGHVC